MKVNGCKFGDRPRGTLANGDPAVQPIYPVAPLGLGFIEKAGVTSTGTSFVKGMAASLKTSGGEWIKLGEIVGMKFPPQAR